MKAPTPKLILESISGAIKICILLFITFYITGTVQIFIEYAQRSTRQLINDLGHRNEEIREQSFEELEKRGANIREQLIRAFENKYNYNICIHRKLLRLLSVIKSPESKRVLIDALKDKDMGISCEASFLLKYDLENTLEYLIPLLKTGDLELKAKVLGILENYGRHIVTLSDYRIIEPLISLLKEGTPKIKILSIEVLKHFDNEKARQAVIDCLSDTNPAVRLTAIKALGEIGNPFTVNLLLANLKHGDPMVRIETIKALSKPGFVNAVPGIISLLGDEDWRVRYYAVVGLGRIGDKAAVPVLVGLLEDKDSLIRRVSVYALGEIGHESAVPVLAKAIYNLDYYIQQNALKALLKIGKPGLETLLKAAADENYDWGLRQVALTAIGYIKDQRAVIPVIRLLRDSHSEIRKYALSALEEIEDRRAIEPIRKLAESDPNSDVRRIAQDILKKLEMPVK